MIESKASTGLMVKVPIYEYPDGEFKGAWGGYDVFFNAKGKRYCFRTVDEIRCLSTPCIINILGGNIEVRTK